MSARDWAAANTPLVEARAAEAAVATAVALLPASLRGHAVELQIATALHRQAAEAAVMAVTARFMTTVMPKVAAHLADAGTPLNDARLLDAAILGDETLLLVRARCGGTRRLRRSLLARVDADGLVTVARVPGLPTTVAEALG
ncbi:hypothetical protein LG299_12565 [Microbacterium lacus]|uniref:hypothetical protein n=1 Tax=Microbacterium lacus TaxID=415217 RepID=UPI0038509718